MPVRGLSVKETVQWTVSPPNELAAVLAERQISQFVDDNQIVAPQVFA
jgi:hypothetical protein